MRNFLSILMLLFVTNVLSQTPPSVIWSRLTNSAQNTAVTYTANNQIIVTGTNEGVNNHRTRINRYDSAGNVLSSAILEPQSGLHQSSINDIKYNANGKAYFCGYTQRVLEDGYAPEGRQLWIGALDAANNINNQVLLFQYKGTGTYGDGTYGNGNCLDFSKNGTHYVVAGTVNGENHPDAIGYKGAYDAYVVKLDLNNNVVWKKCFGGTGYDEILSVVAVNDGYVLTGSSYSNNFDVPSNAGILDIWIFKIDENGLLQWSKTFGGSGYDRATSTTQTTDGGFIVCGNTFSNNGTFSNNYGATDAFVLKIDANGNLEWQKTYGGLSDERFKHVREYFGNHLLVMGESFSNNNDLAELGEASSGWIALIDKDTHNFIWQKRIGSPVNETALGPDSTLYLGADSLIKLDKCYLNNVISITPASSYCQGISNITIQSITPAPYGSYTYQWQQSVDNLNFNNISGATGVSCTTGVINQTTYYRRVVTSGGCGPNVTSNVISISAIPAPSKPSITPGSSSTFCSGGSVTLNSSSTVSNQWYKDGNMITGATGQSYVAKTIGIYTVRITNEQGCYNTSAGITVTINSNPSAPIITSDGSLNFCTGSSVSLSSSYANNNQWYKNNNIISGATSQQYIVTSSGNYTVQYTTSTGCQATSSEANVTATPLPAPTITANAPLSFCPGGSVTLTSSAASGNQWYKNNVPIPGATSTTYYATQLGSYTATYTQGTCTSLPSSPKAIIVMDCNFPTNPYVISSLDSNTLSSSYNFRYNCKPLTVGNITYFPAYKNYYMQEPGLWKTDGTMQGTSAIKTISYFNTTFLPTRLTNVNGIIFFTTLDGSNGSNSNELWKTDGTEAGTVLVKGTNPGGSSSSNILNLITVGNTLFFTINNELWKSDGTEAGTVLVKAGVISSAQNETGFGFATLNGVLYFCGYDSINGDELWKSDGTTAGTVLIKNIRSGSAGSSPASLTVAGSTIYFVAYGTSSRELWKTDGTNAGTVLVNAIGNFGSASGYPYLYNANGIIFFAGGSGADYELWKSDGTNAGTGIVKDINSGSNGSFPQYITVANGNVYFMATTATSGYELWKSDGTPGGTVMVKDILPGSNSSEPAFITYNNGYVYFQAGTTTNGRELWKSDGTEAGTVLVKDINNGNASSGPFLLTTANTKLFFWADNGKTGLEPWISDGSTSGTFLLKDINTTSSNNSNTGPISNFTNHNGILYFVGQKYTNNNFEKHLWRSNGTDTGTVNITASYNNNQLANADFNNLISYNNDLVFKAGQSIFKTDGINVSNLNLTASNPIYEAGNKLYYIGPSITPPSNAALYLMDANGNTARLKDTVQYYTGVDDMIEMNGYMYFSGYSPTTGYELWKTDGTIAGTILVKDITPGTGSTNFGRKEVVNGWLYFTAGTQLWKTDGTTANTTIVYSPAFIGYMRAYNNKLFFNNYVNGLGYELWSSDGTTVGTTLLKDIYPGSIDGLSTNPQFTVAGNYLFFVANDSTTGNELWKTDGTATGTQRVKDIAIGIYSSNPYSLTEVAGFLCFAADDMVRGSELWMTNGNESCTNVVSDLKPNQLNALDNGSNPQNLTNVNGVLYYSAYVPYGGKSLCKYNPLLGTNLATEYTFNGIGNWSDESNWCNNNKPPAVLPAGCKIVIKPSTGGDCHLNTPLTISKGAMLIIADGAKFVVEGSYLSQ